MNPTHIGLCLALSAASLFGQAIDERLAPKTPPAKGGKTQLPEAATPAPAAVEEDVQVTDKLVGLVVIRSKEEFNRDGLENVSGLQIRNIPLINGPEFAAIVQPYFGRPASFKSLRELQRKIILYCRAHDRPLVDVIVPNQEIKGGVVQLVLIEGRIGNVTVRNEGRKWFSDELIARSVRVAPGDVIREKRLLSDINWANRNPFREVGLAFKQGDKPGLSDLQLQVEDRLPIRVFAGYEDTGSKLTGEDRLIAGFNWGNAFMLDHQLNYQYTTDPSFDRLTAHSGSYIIPLPWRHSLTFYGSYVDISANGSSPNYSQKGLNYQASMRYAVPLPLIHNYQQEVSAGFDFKRNENDLLFVRTSVQATETGVSQLALGYTGLLTDPWGRTSLGLQGFYSPGGVFGNNQDKDYNASHGGATADYYYGRLNIERATRLPWEASWIVRGLVQGADGNLIPSEQLGMGGYNTVRGYDEREANGDRGFFVSTELRTPPFSILRMIRKTDLADQLQFLAFMDYGLVENVDPIASTPGVPGESTSHFHSAGGGLRYTVNRYFSLRFDYGFQIHKSGQNASDYRSRAHIGVIGSF